MSNTTISVTRETRHRLALRGAKVDSYDTIVNRLLDELEELTTDRLVKELKETMTEEE